MGSARARHQAGEGFGPAWRPVAERRTASRETREAHVRLPVISAVPRVWARRRRSIYHGSRSGEALERKEVALEQKLRAGRGWMTLGGEERRRLPRGETSTRKGERAWGWGTPGLCDCPSGVPAGRGGRGVATGRARVSLKLTSSAMN